MEEEHEGSLPFMDVKFTRESRGGLGTDVYQKPTHTNRYVQFDSHQPMQVKSEVVQCLTNRAIMISSNKEKQSKVIFKIRKVLTSNGYWKKFVNGAIALSRSDGTDYQAPTENRMMKLTVWFSQTFHSQMGSARR